MLFRTTETAYEREIELASSNIVLFRAFSTTERDLPSSIPFAIPLTPDVPQCIHTPHSSLTHVLTATLHPTNPDKQSISKATIVHTRRYTSHSSNLEIVPESHTLDDPTRVEVEIPRASFKAGEPIPLYVKVPPPRRELVVDEGLRLRNIRAELIRVVQVKREGDDDDDDDDKSDAEETTETDFSPEEGPSAQTSTAIEKPSQAPWSPLFQGASYKTIVSRSGASCRFHSSRAVQLRFVLRQPPPSVSTSDQPRNSPESEYGFVDADGDCCSITQLSLLHSVSFRVNVHVSFVDMTNRTERFSTISIPIVIVPPPAMLPEVEESVDAAYQKKHDKPPARTVRLDDVDVSAPRYHEGEAGPSVHGNGAPPPFEERDAPPPFSHSQEASTSSRLPLAPPPFSLNNPGPSTSSHLPTFIESETEIYIPQTEGNGSSLLPILYPIIPGEGTAFGFLPSAQFDGHSEDMQRSSTPPPTLEMATRDTDVTVLADLDEPQRTMEAIGIALEQQEDTGRRSELPPPPPAMDDPEDPPPSIDSDYRTPDLHLRHSPPPSHPPGLNTSPERNSTLRSSSPAANNGQTNASSHGHAPPPYLVPDNEEQQEEHVTRPPPYVDLMPPTSDQGH